MEVGRDGGGLWRGGEVTGDGSEIMNFILLLLLRDVTSVLRHEN